MTRTRPTDATRGSQATKAARQLTLLPLITATYFMVAGGPFGLEDIVQDTGYAGAIVILLLTPLLWSVPTALMVSELASALPEEGGFYVWVRRAMGPFWGFQESWLTLAGSFFEMALYPALFVSYLGRFAPGLAGGHKPLLLGLAMIALCTAWNIGGARAVGGGSVLMSIILLGPFAVLMVLALFHPAPNAPHIPLRHADILGGILIAMWNYMGWDNLSTIGGEVARPQRNYPLAMLGAVTLVVLSYILPLGAVARTAIDPNTWATGGWVDVARTVGGETLAIGVTLAGVIGAVGSFNALMLSFSRLPLVMAEDGYLPKIFARRHSKTGAPWVAILVCAVVWAAFFPLGFERLVILDVLLTGLSILLEFWALVALRIREPQMPRPYRVPGGLVGAVVLAVPPTVLMAAATLRNHNEQMGSVNALTVGAVLVALGPVLYYLSKSFGARGAVSTN